jgi:hypothetical protein
LYEIYYNWAFAIGKKIMEPPNGNENLLKRLIYNIRAEETPGRFLDRLSETLGEYYTNRNLGIDVSMHPDLYRNKQPWFADRFYYLKSSILTGLLNALSSPKGKKS